MHMVHTNIAYNLSDAINHNDGYLVVGVLFDESKNSKIRVILTWKLCMINYDYQ